MTDDGHSPATCTYNECKAESDTPCPFLKNEASPKEREQRRLAREGTCKHEWRQYWYVKYAARGPVSLPSGYFCIYCKTVDQ